MPEFPYVTKRTILSVRYSSKTAVYGYLRPRLWHELPEKGTQTTTHRPHRRRDRALAVIHKDRLLHLGAELVLAVCEAKESEVVIIDQGEDTSFEEDLAKDVLRIVTVFGARLYGSRSHKTKQTIDSIQEAVNAG